MGTDALNRVDILYDTLGTGTHYFKSISEAIRFAEEQDLEDDVIEVKINGHNL